MLSEEALILLAATGAIVLLVLGALELLWPSRPRHPARRSQAAPATPAPPAAPEASAPPPEAPVPLPAAAVFTKPVPLPEAPAPQAAPVRNRRSKVSPHARPHARGRAVPSVGPAVVAASSAGVSSAPAVVEPAVVPVAEARPAVEDVEEAQAPARAAAEEVVAAPAEEPVTAPPAPPRLLDPLVVETCFSLYQDRCYDEAISVGESALQRVRDEALSEQDAHEVAALWSVVALAKQDQGDDEGARVALEAALDVAPVVERATYRQHLAALALNAAQTCLARAESHETEGRVAELRAALAWADRGLSAVPAHEQLAELSERAQEALWPAYEQAVNRLLQRQEFETARGLLRAALDDPKLPSAWAEDFQQLLTGTFGGEIGQLTAQAIRSMQEERESEALAALQRAEELLATIPDAALPPKRREEVDQRLWWGYTRLGMRRVDSGEYEEALDPLVHALRFADISPDRQEETRAALVRALEGVADLRALAIRQLNDDGHRDEAVLRTETLRELLRSCMELGISEDALSVAFAKTQRLGEELGLEDHA